MKLYYHPLFIRSCCFLLIIFSYFGETTAQKAKNKTHHSQKHEKNLSDLLQLDTIQIQAVRWDARYVKNSKVSNSKVRFDNTAIYFQTVRRDTLKIPWKCIANISYRKGEIYVVGKEAEKADYQRQAMVLKDASNHESMQFLNLLKRYARQKGATLIDDTKHR
ncbi:hypothetical protein [Sphingobacterium sp. FBM7-1]|uniref:hypothetical protein n=1 Tax=Sphingobacterium sp. FBM7-1 TaxID=2886688 RepID=UPI001D11E91B|nr:hypothetical protein [Sphingobacterium sp. FBM7-1]MCC2599668.1 hypothetical protein [Sphingobacterium sp. FBM7-1]